MNENNIINVSMLSSQEEKLTCPEFSNTSSNIISDLAFWVGGVSNCTIGVIGFLMNFISAYVLLTNPFLQNTFNKLLSNLLIIDNFCLLFILVEVISKKFSTIYKSSSYNLLYPYLFHPFRNISLTSSIFMTIGIAHERYRAIQFPLAHHQMRGSSGTRRILLLKYTLTVVLLATLINIPKFFEAELDWTCNAHYVRSYNTSNVANSEFYQNGSDETCAEWKPRAIPTDLRKDPNYSRYYNALARLVFLGITPFVLLTYFNYKICNGMRLPSLLTENDGNYGQGVRSEVRRNQENDAAKVLIGIVVVFIICHTLRVTIDVYEMINIEKIILCHGQGRHGVHSWVMMLNELSSAMVTLNSSVNMIIYGLIKPNIRQHIFRFKRRIYGQDQTNKTQEDNIFELHSLLTVQRSAEPTRNL